MSTRKDSTSSEIALGRKEERLARRRAHAKIRYEANKEAILARQKIRYEANKEAVLAKCKAYRLANKEAVAAQKKVYQQVNREHESARGKAHYQANKEAYSANNEAWREANKERKAETDKAYYKANKERINAYRKAWSLKRNYGVTREQYDSMMEAQGHRCLCCKAPFGLLKASQPHLDHCHATGRIRGILCCQCNQVLGFAHDSASILLACARYLRRSEHDSGATA